MAEPDDSGRAQVPSVNGTRAAESPHPFVAAFGAAATRAERVLLIVCTIQASAAGLAVAGMVILLAGSSMGRYVFGTPIPVTEELGGLLFVTLAFLSVTEGFMADRQVRVQVVWRLLPPRIKGWAMVVGHGLSVIGLVIIMRATWDFAYFSYQVGAQTYITEILVWPWMMLIPVSLAILVLATVVRMAVDVHAILIGQPVKEAGVASIDI